MSLRRMRHNLANFPDQITSAVAPTFSSSLTRAQYARLDVCHAYPVLSLSSLKNLMVTFIFRVKGRHRIFGAMRKNNRKVSERPEESHYKLSPSPDRSATMVAHSIGDSALLWMQNRDEALARPRADQWFQPSLPHSPLQK